MTNTSTPQEGGRQETASSSTALPDGCAVNDTFQCAMLLAGGEQAKGSYVNGQEYQYYYKLTVEQPGAKTFALQPMPNVIGVYADFFDAN